MTELIWHPKRLLALIVVGALAGIGYAFLCWLYFHPDPPSPWAIVPGVIVGVAIGWIMPKAATLE